MTMIIKKITLYLAYSILFSSFVVENSYASQESLNDTVYKKVRVPAQLTYDQVQSLKNGEVKIGPVHIIAKDPNLITSKMPSNWRFITNSVYKKSKAKMVSKHHEDGAHLCEFTAVYSFPKWFNFTVDGYDERFLGVPFINDIDAEAEEVGAIVPKGSPQLTHIKLSPDDLIVFEQYMIVASGFPISFFADSPEVQGVSSSGLKEAVFDGSQYVFSFFVKPLAQKYVPGAKAIYPEVETFTKAMGYATVTHFLVDLAKNRGKLSSPLLIKDQEENTDQQSSSSTALQTNPPRNEKLHAASRILGHAVSFAPVLPGLRDLGTMYVSRQGYPTITHYVMGQKEMTDTQIQELRTSHTKLAEEGVAVAVKTFIPYGHVAVGVSHALAPIVLKDSSVTAWAIHKVTGKESKDPAQKE